MPGLKMEKQYQVCHECLDCWELSRSNFAKTDCPLTLQRYTCAVTWTSVMCDPPGYESPSLRMHGSSRKSMTDQGEPRFKKSACVVGHSPVIRMQESWLRCVTHIDDSRQQS
jgi:hypothetical protein